MITITISGSESHSSPDEYKVHFGKDEVCQVTAVTPTTVKCTLGVHPAGDYNITVLVKGMGFSNGLPFVYQLSAGNPDVDEGGYGGGRTIELTGKGFSMKTEVTVCDAPCKVMNVTGGNVLECMTGTLPDHESKSGRVAIHMFRFDPTKVLRFNVKKRLAILYKMVAQIVNQ